MKSSPARILKENRDIFAPFLMENFNNSLLQKTFPEDLKLRDITSLFKMMKPHKSETIDLSQFCPLYQRSLSDFYMPR